MLVLQAMLGHYNDDVIIEVPPSDKPQKITVSLCQIRGEKIRWGFDAPKEVDIARRQVVLDRMNNPPAKSPA